MRISVITPCLNGAAYIERAIVSVLAQKDADVEHIIMDGGSTDGTLDIVARYPHLRCESGPDRNQVHAMNKGFALATGDIIVYLNADDYFYENTFAKVRKAFGKGVDMVMGKVEVLQERARADGTSEIQSWINDPKCDWQSVLRHWELNSFCYNPVGYFYARHVQEAIPFREEHGPKMDMAFLLAVAERFVVKRINHVCGAFAYSKDTQTAKEQSIPSYWRFDNFPFISEAAERLLDPKALRQFNHDRERGYCQIRHTIAKEGIAQGRAEELMTSGEVFFLPQMWDEMTLPFVDLHHLATQHDTLHIIVGHGKVASKSILSVLKKMYVQKNIATLPYHFHILNIYKSVNELHKAIILPHMSLDNYFSLSIIALMKKKLKIKLIIGVREPLSLVFSMKYELRDAFTNEDMMSVDNDAILNSVFNWHDLNIKSVFGVDIFEYEFNRKEGYSILKFPGYEILLYTLESLPEIFGKAMEEFVGISGLVLPKVNAAENKSYGKLYKSEICDTEFSRKYLDEIYSSKYVKHFYTDEQIEKFYKKWLER